MAFSKHNNLETPDSGTQNWASSLNENFELLEQGSTIKATAGTTIAINDVLFIDTSGKFQLALADTTVANEYVGFSTAGINNNADGFARVNGYFLGPDFFFNAGERVFLSAVTPGGITSIAPTDIVQVGVALATNEILIRPHGATLESHDELLGLSDDDHTQYLRTDNFRSTSGLTVTGILDSSGVDTTHLTATNSTIIGLTVNNNLAVSEILPDSGSIVKMSAGLTVTSEFNMSGNMGVGTIDQFGAGIGAIGIANATVNVTENPIGGGALWVQDGNLFYRGSAGTTTIIALA